MPVKDIKGIIFDFGFTLFYFRDVSLEKYLDCYKRGLEKSVVLLKEHHILKDDGVIGKFNRIFKRKRRSFFQQSVKTKNEFPTYLVFKHVLESMVEKKLINDLTSKSEDFYTDLADLYHSCEEDEWIPFDYTKDTLEKLTAYKEIKLAVLSNHPNHSSIKKLLKKYDLSKYFETIVTSAKFGKRKPNPDIFNYTLKKMGLEESAGSCFMCGDEHADIVGGHRAGIQTILCERVYQFPFENEINVPNVINVKNISEIFNYL